MGNDMFRVRTYYGPNRAGIYYIISSFFNVIIFTKSENENYEIISKNIKLSLCNLLYFTYYFYSKIFTYVKKYKIKDI